MFCILFCRIRIAFDGKYLGVPLNLKQFQNLNERAKKVEIKEASRFYTLHTDAPLKCNALKSLNCIDPVSFHLFKNLSNVRGKLPPSKKRFYAPTHSPGCSFQTYIHFTKRSWRDEKGFNRHECF